MNIHEYQAKELLAQFNVSTSKGLIIDNHNEAEKILRSLNSNSYVIKAQIHAGGRGKSGGVKIAHDIDTAIAYVKQMIGSVLKTSQNGREGQIVHKVYCSQLYSYKKEYYLSALIDRSSAKIIFLASSSGGMDIEEIALTNPEKIYKTYIDLAIGIQNFNVRQLFYSLGLEKILMPSFTSIMRGMYEIMITKDAYQVEINPLVLLPNGIELMALDAKISFDDNALYRHPEINSLRDKMQEDPYETKAKELGVSYIKMDGNIGCMVNGAGLAMATMDIIKKYGGSPANFLDIGGAADKVVIKEALKLILSHQNLKAVLINIFGGIVRCDVIAKAILELTEEMLFETPLVIRLAGTNIEEAKMILSETKINMSISQSLDEATKKVLSFEDS